MINIKDMTPDTYYNNSRDFQVLGRTLEVLLNYTKMNVDIMKGNYDIKNIDDSLLDLLLLTLGFEETHSYSKDSLKLLPMVFKWMVRKKGTEEAINYAVYLLLRSQHIEQKPSIKIRTLGKIRSLDEDFDDLYTIDIYLPKETKDRVLLKDLFEYILPAGFRFNIYSLSGEGQGNEIKLSDTDSFEASLHQRGDMETNGISRSDKLDEWGKTYTSVVYGGEDSGN